MCFGIELTMNSVVAPYFHAYHGLTPQAAGLIGGLYGLMNLFARSWGGLLSDAANKKFGMRGRLWAMWIVQTLEGVMCMIMAAITLSYESPFGQEKTPAYIQLTKYNDYGLGTSTWVNVADYADAAACEADAKKCFKVNACGCRYAQSSLHTSCARSCTHPPLLSSGLTSRRRRCRRRLASRRRRCT
jgi:hypothetical protein